MKAIPGFELAGYQRAARTLLFHPLVTEVYPNPGALPLIRRWATELREDLAETFGYRLELSRTTARLLRAVDHLDSSQPARTQSDRPFDRRRYAYLALTLAALGRAGTQVALSELADTAAADATRIAGLGLSTERAAFVDAVAWLDCVARSSWPTAALAAGPTTPTRARPSTTSTATSSTRCIGRAGWCSTCAALVRF